MLSKSGEYISAEHEEYANRSNSAEDPVVIRERQREMAKKENAGSYAPQTIEIGVPRGFNANWR